MRSQFSDKSGGVDHKEAEERRNLNGVEAVTKEGLRTEGNGKGRWKRGRLED